MSAFVLSIAVAAAAPTASGDLRALVRFVERAHPRPYAYVDPDALDALVREEAARLDALDAPSDLEVGRSFHRVLARLGDGHLALALPSFQPDAGPLSLVPVLPKRVGDEVLVDASTAELPPGTALLAIDGVPIEEIWTTLSDLVLADARSPVARRAALERGFARHYPLAYGLRPAYVVRVRLPDGEERDLTLDGVERDVLAALPRGSAPAWGAGPAEAGPPWPWLVRLDPTTVLLRMPSFGVPDPDEYTRRIDGIFASLDATDTLVLDLRGNEGGLRTHGMAVLDHVLDRPYAQWTRLAVRVRQMPQPGRVTFPFVPEEGLTERFDDARREGGQLVVDGDPLAPLMQPDGPGWAGRVVAFVDGATDSAAVEMVVALRASRPDATLIGEETGGECGRHVGEMPVAWTAPASGITALVSLVELTHVPTVGCEPGRGVRPDREVVYDRAAFLSGRDPYLDALWSVLGPG